MKGINDSDMENVDLEDIGEEVKFTFDKYAFKSPKEMHCGSCGRVINKTRAEIEIPDTSLFVRLNVFRCNLCNKEYLDFEEAEKLDKALVMARLMKYDNYKIKKALSFDGDNYIFRIPVDVARNLGKKPSADMVPLSSTDFFIHLNKNK